MLILSKTDALIEVVVVIIAIAYLIPDQDSSFRRPSNRALQKKKHVKATRLISQPQQDIRL